MKLDKKISFILLLIFFTIFVFSSDGHRFTIDEDMAQQQATKIALFQHSSDFVPGETRLYHDYPYYKNSKTAPICYNEALCYTSSILYSLTESPFILFNHIFQIITPSTIELTNDDFSDAHYVFWRNSFDSDITFLELFYGPVFGSLIIFVFYLLLRSFSFNIKTSILMCVILGLSTLIWPYTQTTLNSLPSTFFSLTGFYFFKKFMNTKLEKNLFFSSILLGCGFLIRNDIILIIIPIFIVFLYLLRNNEHKIRKFVTFVIPLFSFYFISLLEEYVKFHNIPFNRVISFIDPTTQSSTDTFFENIFGLLFSPGVGLFIFVPILLTVFFSFPQFYKKHKIESLLFISVAGLFIINSASLQSWHGLVSWGPRYLIPVIPFLLIPLASCFESYKNFSFKLTISVLSILGFVFSLSYIVNDIHWYVWGQINSGGLFGIDRAIDGIKNHLNIDPVTIWTFQYSQLTHSLLMFFLGSQPDIYLLKLFNLVPYAILLVVLLGILIFILNSFTSKASVSNLNNST